jgi:2-polyprenyl-3-methyl-5-hydroxy-6-metoxy-1,4-benzoquinol methylase
MEYTGERFVPGIDAPDTSYEHWHRYQYASLFVQGKDVLDIACGEGYGSYLLAKTANRVVGVDVSRDAVNHAAGRYIRGNLTFREGSLVDVPVDGSANFDVVISFETIEHVPEEGQLAFMNEVKRLLKPSGMLLISTPNKLSYSDIPQYENEFHMKEFYANEFRAFLELHFDHVSLLGQRIYPVSYVWNSEQENPGYSEFKITLSDSGFRPSDDPKVPLNLLAACSASEIPDLPQSAQLDLSNQAFALRDARINDLNSRLGDAISHLSSKQGEVDRLMGQLSSRETQIGALREQLANARAQVHELEDRSSGGSVHTLTLEEEAEQADIGQRHQDTRESNPVRPVQWEISRERWISSNPDLALTWGKEVSGDQFINKIQSYGAFSNLGTILEIGPGYGRLPQAIVRARIPFEKYYGIDISKDTVKFLRGEFPDDRFSFIHEDAEKCELDFHYDLLLSSLTLKHLYPTFEACLGNIARFANSNCGFFFDLIEGQAAYFEDDGLTYLRFYTKEEVEQILKNVGLVVEAFDYVEHDKDHIRLLVVAGFNKVQDGAEASDT